MEHQEPRSDPPDVPEKVLDVAGIASRARAAIRAHNLKQADVAEALHISPKTVERRLKGEREFTANEIGLLARRLGVKVESLLCDAT